MKTNILIALCLLWAALLAPKNLAAQEDKNEKQKTEEKGNFSESVTDYAKEIQRISLEMQKLQKEIADKRAADKNDPQIEGLQQKLNDLEEEMEQQSEKLEEAVESFQEDIMDDIDVNAYKYDYHYEYGIDESDGDTTIRIHKNDSTGKDEIVIRIGDDGISWKKGEEEEKGMKNMKKKSKPLPKFKTQFLGLDLGVNAFGQRLRSGVVPGERDPMQLDVAKSAHVTLHLFRQGISLYKNKVYMTMGLALDFHNFRLAKDIVLTPETIDTFKYTILPEKLKKSKLEVNYLNLPVMLHYESNPRNPNRSFKAGFGAYGGVRYSSYTKFVTTQGKKEKYHDDFNLNPINYGLRAQVGYGPFTIYSQASYSMLFAEGSGTAPWLNPITVGLVVNGFKWR
jgi:hypothetical protein